MTDSPRDENGHIFSSAGLIWRHYSMAYMRAIKIPKEITVGSYTFEPRPEVEEIIRNRWIKIIDMVDNGQMNGPTVISEVVNAMRPIWPEKTRAKSDELFIETVTIIRKMLERACFHVVDQLMFQTKFLQAEKRYFEDDRILLVDGPTIPGNHSQYITEHFIVGKTQTYIDEEEERWLINPIKTRNGSGTYRTPIPEELLGLRSEEIFDHTGIVGINYIHHTGFVIMCDDADSAVEFCKWLLDKNQDGNS